MQSTKVLIVEDEWIVSRVISEELALLGYIVTGIATSDVAALASVRDQKPDIVLVDIVLKGSKSDGVSLAATLRQEFQLPVIFITAHTDDATLERAKNTEPFGYLVKPFNERDLRVALETALYKHKMEQQLAESEAFLSAILRSTSDAIIATDSITKVTYMNPAAEKLTGWNKAEALGQEITSLIQFEHEQSGESVENPVSVVLRSGQVAYLCSSTVLVDKVGLKKPVGDSASPLSKTPEAIDGVVLVISDISDRRKAETLTVERNAIQQALAQEMATSALKSQFMAMLSHEARTPLTNILFSAEFLGRNDISSEKKLQRLEKIRQSVAKMTSMLEDILTLGKLEIGNLKCNPTLLNLESFCRDLIEETSDRQIQTSPDVEQPVLVFDFHGCQEARLDPKLLQHILSNLLSNAVKYSPHGGKIHLEVTCEPQESTATTSCVTFRVSDRGIGIPANELDTMFDLFQRATNTKKIAGSGLGLAICKRAVDIHGGQITVESQVDVGTTFTVTIDCQ